MGGGLSGVNYFRMGNLDLTQAPASFAQQVTQLAAIKKCFGVRIGGGIFPAQCAPLLLQHSPNVMTNSTMMAGRSGGINYAEHWRRLVAVGRYLQQIPALNSWRHTYSIPRC